MGLERQSKSYIDQKTIPHDIIPEDKWIYEEVIK